MAAVLVVAAHAVLRLQHWSGWRRRRWATEGLDVEHEVQGRHGAEQVSELNNPNRARVLDAIATLPSQAEGIQDIETIARRRF